MDSRRLLTILARGLGAAAFLAACGGDASPQGCEGGRLVPSDFARSNSGYTLDPDGKVLDPHASEHQEHQWDLGGRYLAWDRRVSYEVNDPNAKYPAGEWIPAHRRTRLVVQLEGMQSLYSDTKSGAEICVPKWDGDYEYEGIMVRN